MDITKLQGNLPGFIYQQLPDILPKFFIDGPLRLSHLLGQSAHESMNFTHLTENLNYSGEALYKLFKTHFTDQQEADSYAHQPERIANRIYSNRIGNGDEQSGEGWTYRGRGTLQLTGKSNYKSLGDFLGVDLLTNPELVATDYCLSSAAFFFYNNHLWSICDKGINIATITIVTRHMNGGDLGLSDRIKFTQEFYHLLTS